METIEIIKNCENCNKFKVCKFVEKYEETVKSNLFYQMFAYAEHNNLMSIFKDNATYCIHYGQKIPDGFLNYKIHGSDIFSRAIRKYCEERWPDKRVSSISFGSKVEDIKIHYMKDNGYVQLEVDLSEIEKIYEVKYVNKK